MDEHDDQLSVHHGVSHTEKPRRQSDKTAGSVLLRPLIPEHGADAVKLGDGLDVIQLVSR